MPLSLGGNGVISGIDWAGTGGGLAHVATTSFSAASTVSVNNCFTATYANYRIVVTGSSSAGADLTMRFRVSGSDASGSSYGYARSYLGWAGSAANTNSASTTSITLGGFSTVFSAYGIDVFSPFATARSGVSSSGLQNTFREIAAGIYDLDTSFDGFSFIPSTGTITGTVRVYGYIND